MHEDDGDQRAVLVVTEHAVGQTDAREDQPDLAAGSMPRPDEQPVTLPAEHPEAGDQLADAGHDDEHAR